MSLRRLSVSLDLSARAPALRLVASSWSVISALLVLIPGAAHSDAPEEPASEAPTGAPEEVDGYSRDSKVSRDDDESEKSDDDPDSSDDPGADFRVETVADPEQKTPDRQPSGWVSSLTLDDEFARGSDLGRALERVEGVTVRRRSGLGQPAFATVRGGSPRQLAVHLNGIRIGSPAGIGFDVGTLTPQGIDSVDVYRGGAAAPWGAGALTGAMDLQMRPPDESGWRATATTMGGSFGTVGLSAEAAGGGDALRGEIGASWRRSRGDFGFVDNQGTPHTRVNNGHEQLSVTGTVGGNLGGGEWTAALLHESAERGAPGPSEFQYAYREATLERQRTVATADWSKKGVASPDWGVVDLEVGAGLVHRPMHYRNPEGFLGGEPVDHSSTSTSVTGRARVSGYFDAGNIAHLDLELRTQHFSASSGLRESSDLRAARQTLALGLSDELLLFDEALSLVAGLRAELVAGRDELRVPFIPSGGLIWRPLDWLRLKANVARSHRVPDFDELYLRTETVRGNPNLVPERALNADVGAVFGSEDDPARGHVTLFYSHTRDMIAFLPKTAYLFRAENLSDATSAGVEAAGDVEIAERFRLRGTYTYTRAHLDAVPKIQLAHHPRHRGMVSARTELAGLGPLEGLRSLELSANVSARSSVNLDSFGSLSNPPYAQLDFGATIRPTESLGLGLELRNATDNRRGADFLQRPLPGRAFYASIRLHEGSLAR